MSYFRSRARFMANLFRTGSFSLDNGLATDNVTSTSVDSDTVTSTSVSSDTVTSTSVSSDTVTSTSVNSDTVTADALVASSIDLNGGVAEKVYNVTGTVLDPANGTLQYKTLTANTTLTESISEGESITLMVADGSSYTVTWPSMQWSGGEAPTLPTTGYGTVVLWKVGGVLYGSSVGDMS